MVSRRLIAEHAVRRGAGTEIGEICALEDPAASQAKGWLERAATGMTQALAILALALSGAVVATEYAEAQTCSTGGRAGMNPHNIAGVCPSNEYRIVIDLTTNLCGACRNAASCTTDLGGQTYTETVGGETERICGSEPICNSRNKVLKNGVCRLPAGNAGNAECAELNLKRPVFDMSEPTRCRSKNASECENQIADPTVDNNCRDASNDNECNMLFSTTIFRPIHDPRAENSCRSKNHGECMGQYSDPTIAGNCRNSKNVMECATVNKKRPQYDTNAQHDCRPFTLEECYPLFADPNTDGNCRSAGSDFECVQIAMSSVAQADFRTKFDMAAPMVGNSDTHCRVREHSECEGHYSDPSVRGNCRAASSKEECIEIDDRQPLLQRRGSSASPSFTYPTNPADPLLLTMNMTVLIDPQPSNCRAPNHSRDCLLLDQSMPIFLRRACGSAEPSCEDYSGNGRVGSCHAATSDAMCRASDFGLEKMDGGSCRELTQADCAAREILDSLTVPRNCRLPRNGAECASLNSLLPIYDESASGNCRAKTQAECGMERLISDARVEGNCRAPANAGECRNFFGSNSVVEGGKCETECDPGRIAEFGICRDLRAGDCEGERPTFDEASKSCVLPRNSEDCSEVNPIRPFYDREADGNCRSALDNRECQDANPNTPILGANRQCAPAGSHAECRSIYPDSPIRGEGAEEGSCNPAADNEECRNAHPSFPIRGDDGSCNPATDDITGCGDGLFVIAGECRAAASDEECRRLNPAQPKLDLGTCRGAQNQSECLTGEYFDASSGICRSPASDEECRAAAAERPIFECRTACRSDQPEGFCRALEVADCRSSGQILNISGDVPLCRDPQSSRECAFVDAALPVFDAGSCRERREADCVSTTQKFENGECVALTEADCSNGETLVLGRCAPATAETCSETQKFEGGECVNLTAEDCADSDVFESGRCRPRTQSDCTPRILSADGGCRSPANALECENIGNFSVIDNGVCAERCGEGKIEEAGGRCVQASSAACAADNPRQPIYDEESGSCVGSDWCVATGAGIVIEDGACAEACRGNRIPDPETQSDGALRALCRDRTQADCMVGGQVLSAAVDGICRSPANIDECAGIAGAGFSVIDIILGQRICATACGEGREPGADGVCIGIGSGSSAQGGNADATEEESDDGASNALPLVAPAIVGAYLLFAGGIPSIFPEFGFAGGAGQEENWTYGGRIEYAGRNWQTYALARNQGSEEGMVYETGGKYRGDFWDASYKTREGEDSRRYEASFGGRWMPGMWEIRPAWRGGVSYDAEAIEWSSASSLGVDMGWISHKWQVRQNAGIAWNSDSDLSEPRVRIDVERQF